MKRLVLALGLAALIPSPVAGGESIVAWCMDGWAGELCFDVTTFQVSDVHLTIGGAWRGDGYPVGNVDHFGRGPAMGLGLLNSGYRGIFLDPVTEAAEYVFDRSVYLGEDDDGQDVWETASSLDDVSVLILSASSGEEGWNEARCYMPLFQRVSGQACRVVSVDEPGALFLLVTGLLGMAMIRSRRLSRPRDI